MRGTPVVHDSTVTLLRGRTGNSPKASSPKVISRDGPVQSPYPYRTGTRSFLENVLVFFPAQPPRIFVNFVRISTQCRGTSVTKTLRLEGRSVGVFLISEHREQDRSVLHSRITRNRSPQFSQNEENARKRLVVLLKMRSVRVHCLHCVNSPAPPPPPTCALRSSSIRGGGKRHEVHVFFWAHRIRSVLFSYF